MAIVIPLSTFQNGSVFTRITSKYAYSYELYCFIKKIIRTRVLNGFVFDTVYIYMRNIEYFIRLPVSNIFVDIKTKNNAKTNLMSFLFNIDL